MPLYFAQMVAVVFWKTTLLLTVRLPDVAPSGMVTVYLRGIAQRRWF